MLIDVPLTPPLASEDNALLSAAVKTKDDISLALDGPIVTVTVYAWFVPSAAVTVYITALVKSLVESLEGLTDAPAETVMVGTKAVTSVPLGAVTLTAVSLIVPVTSEDNASFESAVNTKKMISFAPEAPEEMGQLERKIDKNKVIAQTI